MPRCTCSLGTKPSPVWNPLNSGIAFNASAVAFISSTGGKMRSVGGRSALPVSSHAMAAAMSMVVLR